MTRERVINMIDCILGDNILCDCIEDSTVGCNECRREAADIAINALKEQKTGKWIFVHPIQEDDSGGFLCSCCKYGEYKQSNYYPHCGARMEEQ